MIECYVSISAWMHICTFGPFSYAIVAYHLERGVMSLHDAVGVNCNRTQLLISRRWCHVYGLRCECWMTRWREKVMPFHYWLYLVSIVPHCWSKLLIYFYMFELWTILDQINNKKYLTNQYLKIYNLFFWDVRYIKWQVFFDFTLFNFASKSWLIYLTNLNVLLVYSITNNSY